MICSVQSTQDIQVLHISKCVNEPQTHWFHIRKHSIQASYYRHLWKTFWTVIASCLVTWYRCVGEEITMDGHDTQLICGAVRSDVLAVKGDLVTKVGHTFN